MKKHIIASLVLGCVLFSAALPVLAKQGPPVKIRVLGEPRGVAAGEVFAGTLEILSGSTATLTDFRFIGVGWQVESLAVAQDKAVRQGDRLTIPFAVRAGKDAGPLSFKFEYDGYTVTKALDFSAAHAARMMQSAATVEVPASELPGLAPEVVGVSPQPRPVAMKDTSGDDPSGGAKSTARTITVQGRFVYDRRDLEVVGADGLTVRVYDEDPISDDYLGSTITGPQGYFSIDISTGDTGETNPDLYLTFDAANTICQVQDATWEENYSWKTGTYDSFSASVLDVGWRQSSNEWEDAGLHILTDISRTWRWLLTNEGYDTPTVDVQWPDGTTGAWYNGFWEEIHISEEHEWHEDTHAHEYGHHWINNYSNLVAPDYCNGICDDGDCGHCVWCDETDHDAFSEGFPNWIADVVTRSFLQSYGLEPYWGRSQEDLRTCYVDGAYGDPNLTEGFLGALLRDIEDSGNDDHDAFPGYADVMARGTHSIIDLVATQEPTTPAAFLADYKATYPWLVEELWETAKNCGYEIDTAPPGVAPTIQSSHAVGVGSPDPTVTIDWITPSDDASGIAGYGIYLASAAAMPSTTMDIGDVYTYTTAALAPGTYYFNLRAVDRAGRWSTGYATYGPIVIREAEPSDLTYEVSSVWDYPVVPRNDATATLNDARVSPVLIGNSSSTYGSIYGKNQGESATSVGFEARLYVDDVHRTSWTWSPIDAGGGFFATNRGPITVRGGRHTYTARFDATDQVAETNEGNNVTGHQFIWSPLPLTAGTPVTRSAPPLKDAGWSQVVDGQAKWYNSDGLTTTVPGWWNAIAVYAVDPADDYDVRLHEQSTGAQDGFAANLGYSSRGAGLLDAVLFNRNVLGDKNYDAGVVNAANHTGDYVVEHVVSSSMSFGDSVRVSLAADRYLLLREFYVSLSDTGYISITVDCDPADGPLHAQWRGLGFTTGTLSTADLETVTDAVSGRARLDIHVTESGYNGLAIYRDPRDGNSALSMTVEIQRTPPEVTAYQPAGWYSPVVPRPEGDGTPALVAAPDTLYGNINATHLNMAIINDSPTASPAVLGRIHLDGVYSWWLQWSGIPAHGIRYLNDSSVKTVRGGRHTLDLRLDPLQAFEEIREDNNEYGVQYVWSPLDVTAGSQVQRTMPPARTGGWETVTTNAARWYNCDGLRIPTKTNWWHAMAVMPASGTDVDVRLHPLLAGADDGFASNLAYSGWGPEASDFVLVNYNLSSAVGYDAGVLNISGSGGYTADHAVSDYLGSNPSGPTPPYSIPAGAIIDVHEVQLAAGLFSVHLVEDAGGVDWGLSLMPADAEFMAKSDALAASWGAPAGGIEGFDDVTIPATGYYCLVVWKARTSDLDRTGSYHLVYGSGLSDVPTSAVPVTTSLRGIYPNPFNPQTTIRFDLARAAAAEIAIYDLKGSKIKVLTSERLAAGSHEVLWDGTDRNGQRVASGIYMARLQSDHVSQIMKLTLVK